MLRVDMTISLELILSLAIQLVSVGIMIGIFKTSVSFMQQQIAELKEDQKKYNNYLERLIRVESSVKAIWHNLDEDKHND